jgi:hypothetical protein
MEIAWNGTEAVQVAATISVGGGIRTGRIKGCSRGRRRCRDTPAAAGRGVGGLGTAGRAGGCVGGDIGWDGAGGDGTEELIRIDGRDLEAGAVGPTGREAGLLAGESARDGTGTVVGDAASLHEGSLVGAGGRRSHPPVHASGRSWVRGLHSDGDRQEEGDDGEGLHGAGRLER